MWKDRVPIARAAFSLLIVTKL